jgi:hypothetical protein
MKAQIFKALRTMAFVALAMSAAACGTKYMIKGTPSAPEADGQIVATSYSENSLTVIEMESEHLAPPDRLFGGTKCYVIWARKNSDSPWLRVAKLDYNDGSRKGKVKVATVPLTSFELAVTAEQQESPESPSPNVVFSQKVSP